MPSHVNDANYVVIKEIKDINKYLTEDFEYLCFLDATNITLEATTPYIKFEKIFYILLYFKMKYMILPKPLIFILSEFIVPGVKKLICNIPTCFPP